MARNDDTELLALMRDRMSTAISVSSETRENQLDDLRFYAGSPDNQWQWPKDVIASRGSVQGQTVNGRPCLTINKLPQHVHQVTNDQRQNRPSGKVIPVDDAADIEMAEVFNGMVRHIEYISDADVAYDTACENQVVHGEGFFRIITEYTSPDSFEQDLKIVRIRNPFSVYMDPLIQDPTGSDAKWCFIAEDMLKSEYEAKFPDATPVSTLKLSGIGDQSITQWISESTVRIAEYYHIETKPRQLNQYPGNQTAFDKSPQDRIFRSLYGNPLRTRQSEEKQVKWCKTNGYEILESTVWLGSKIPVIRVVGNELEVEGQLLNWGLVRNAKDAQRMYNYWVSQEAEMLALAPKAPFIGYAGQFEGFETQWKTANTNAWPYLEVNPDVTDGQGAVLPLPQRSQPPMAQTGLIQAKMGAADDIKSATGQYNASLGQTSNERSGKAILARQREGDTGTYHYVDNLARAVRCATRQLIELIPKIYDTERMARIMGEDFETKSVKLNPEQPEAVKEIRDQNNILIEKIFNPGVGKYDVVAVTGPGFATKRQQALEGMAQLLQGNPELWKVAGDLFVKNMDWPGAQEMAKRFAKTIDPKILSDDDDPALQQANQQIQAMGQEMEQMHQMLKSVQQSFEARELDIKEFESTVRAYDAETKRISATVDKMNPDQIQQIVLGTIHSMIDSGDLLAQMPDSQPQMPPQQPGMPPAAPQMPPVG